MHTPTSEDLAERLRSLIDADHCLDLALVHAVDEAALELATERKLHELRRAEDTIARWYAAPRQPHQVPGMVVTDSADFRADVEKLNGRCDGVRAEAWDEAARADFEARR